MRRRRTAAARSSTSSRWSTSSHRGMRPPCSLRPGVERIRTTAESHRRIAIIEVMGRHSGYIALGSAYGQPDIILIPERPVDLDLSSIAIRGALPSAEERRHRVRRRASSMRRRPLTGRPEATSTDPAGNVVLTGAAEALRERLIDSASATGTSATPARRDRPRGHLHPKGRPHPAWRAARCCSTASTRRSSARRPSTCCSRGGTTRSPCCSGAGRARILRRRISRERLP